MTAFCTVMPVLSVAEIVPALVTAVAVLKKLPGVEPAVTLKEKVCEPLPGTVVPPGNVQLIVPVAPGAGEAEGVMGLPGSLLTYAKPAGNVSVIVDRVIAVAALFVIVSV